jgi:Gluconate 2-dehydrogenase subunit 3
MLMPPMRGMPGALECGAPEFLDFLIGASPTDRQTLYRNGLDTLNTRAKKQFGKSFAELDATQADAVIRPLLAPVPWAYDLPKDPALHFMAEAHRDIRTATQNSREWANAGASSGRRSGFGGGVGSYLNPIDPV